MDIHEQKGFHPKIVLIGDSRTRQLRDGLYMQLEGLDRDWLANNSIRYNQKLYHKHESLVERAGPAQVSLHFIWAERTSAIDDYLKRLERQIKKTTKVPLLHVIGFGLWIARSCKVEKKDINGCFEVYKT